MSSRNFQIGLPEGKPSTRVFSGSGGNSRLFGPASPPPVNKKNVPTSQMKEIFSMDDNSETKPDNVSKKGQSDQKNETVDNVKETDSSGCTVQRVRMPPGGFSSGFW